MSKRPTRSKRAAPPEPAPQPTMEMVQAANEVSRLAQGVQWYKNMLNAPLSLKGKVALQEAFLRLFMEE